MKKIYRIPIYIVITIFWMCMLLSNINAQNVLNNGLLRFGTGSENSVNTQGLLQQPWYYNSTKSSWYKLTYYNYPLDMAIGVGGDGSNEWNINGTIVNTQNTWTLTNQVVDVSGYIGDGTVPEYGTIISTGEMEIGGFNFQIETTFTFPEDKGYVQITSKIKNIDTEKASNIRMWVGTRDDYVGESDGPTKVKGNIIDGEFVQIASPADRAAALKIYSGDEAALFFSTSPTGNTSISSCCYFSNAMNQAPSSSSITATGDGSYCYYMRLDDLEPGESDEVVWFYAAGSLSDIAEIIEDVADAAEVSAGNVSYNSVSYSVSVPEDGTGYYIVVPSGSAVPTEDQIVAGVDYGSVPIVASGSAEMVANVDAIFNIAGLIQGTEYDIYFVSVKSNSEYSDVTNTGFSTLGYTVPELTTVSASSITLNSAMSGGEVVDNGGQEVTAEGVCWNTAGDPTLSHNYMEDGSGVASFSVLLAGLSPGTTYYVRAYATNSVGTGYGDEISFTTRSYPVGADDVITINEDNLYTFAPSDFTFSDADNDAFSGIHLLSEETAGTLEYNGADVVAGQLYSDVTLLKFIPDENANGIAYATFTYKVVDSSGAESDATYTYTINVTPVNDAPTALGFSTTSGPYQNIVYSFSTTDFDYSDVENEILDQIRIASVPGNGVLFVDADNGYDYDSGEELSNGSLVSRADLDAGNLQYYTTATASTSFVFEVSDGTEYSSSSYTATLNVIPEPTVTLSAGAENIDETGGSTTVTATLSHTYPETVTIDLAFSGSAVLTDDYTRSETSIAISSGTTGSISLSSVSDILDEDPEIIIVAIDGVSNGSEDGTQQKMVTITDDDATPAVSFNAASQSSTAETGTMKVAAQLSAVSGRDVAIPFTINGSGTATSGVDYTIAASPITIAAGSHLAEITITIATDALDEYDESIIVDMGTPTNASQGAITTHTATIVDDDIPPTVTFMSASQVNINESGVSNITVMLSAPSGRDVTVPFTVNGLGTAAGGGADYSITASPLIIHAGSVSTNIEVAVTPDLMDEYTETIEIDMGAPVNATQGVLTSHTINIDDNDPLPTVTLDVSSSSIAEEAGEISVTGTLSAVSAKAITVYLAFSGTATGGATDYHVAGSSIFISPGNSSGSVALTADQDLLYEGEETIIVDIMGCDNCVETGIQQQSVTITDDDIFPTVETAAVSNYGATLATMGGKVTDSGSSGIIGRGVVYSATDSDPEIGDIGTITDSNGTGIGSFSKSMSDLSPNTTYYVKAYATNIVGTGYGEVESFTTSKLPEAICKNTAVNLDENGIASIGFYDVNGGSNAETGIQSRSLSINSFSCSDVGDNIVTLTITDTENNTAQCQATVTVVDDIAPVLSAVEDVVVELEPGVCESEIDYPEIKVTDNCGAMLEQIAGLGPDGIFPAGTSAEIWQATDNSGNVDVISFNVIVTSVDGPPTIDTLEDIIVTEATSMVLVPLTGISSGEDCEPQDVEVIAKGTNTDLVTSVTVNYEGGSTGSLELTLAPETEGTSEITLTVGDSGGTTTERTFKVTVDTQNNPPFVLNPLADQVVNASYVLKVPISSAAGEIFDDIDDDNLTLAVMEEGAETLPSWATYEGDTLVCSPMIADTGCVNIVVQATDADGATASDTFQVCVDGYPTSIGEIGSGEFEVQMYPNPSTGIVNLDINTSAIHDVALAVMDITGREVLRKQYSAAQTIRFDMSGKVSGMYFVHLNIGGTHIIKKLVIDRK